MNTLVIDTYCDKLPKMYYSAYRHDLVNHFILPTPDIHLLRLHNRIQTEPNLNCAVNWATTHAYISLITKQ
jgi:hypothetical protein